MVRIKGEPASKDVTLEFVRLGNGEVVVKLADSSAGFNIGYFTQNEEGKLLFVRAGYPDSSQVCTVTSPPFNVPVIEVK